MVSHKTFDGLKKTPTINLPVYRKNDVLPVRSYAMFVHYPACGLEPYL